MLRGGVFVVVATSIVLAGCSTCQIQVWGSSDSDDPQVYSVRNPHYVHVGEIVQFRVLVQPDIASYVVMESNGQAYLLDKVTPGYAFAKRFDERWLEQDCVMEARAYKQVGNPDYLVENGVARKLSGGDPPDQFLGAARFQITCYQSKVVIRVPASGNQEPDWSQVVLNLFGPGDRMSAVKLAQTGTDGFTVLGRDAWGEYPVFYEPRINQIHKAGKTRAVLTYIDPATRKERKLETWFDTP
jgi:hypothetical protein